MKNSPVRDNIVQTASELFYQKGYNLTGINEIIKESGIAKATLYHHFPSKDDIGVAYINYKNGIFLESLKVYIAGLDSGKTRIQGLFKFLDLFYSDKAFNGCWCINTISEIPKENIKIRQEIQHQKATFLNYIQSLVSENINDLNDNDQDKLTKKLYLLYEGAIAESHLHGDRWPIQIASEMCEALIK